MVFKLTVFNCLCCPNIFTINGIKADMDDFGELYDHDPDIADDYGCGDMQFDKKSATIDVLKKYHISTDEYDKICNKLEDQLAFGTCCYCT